MGLVFLVIWVAEAAGPLDAGQKEAVLLLLGIPAVIFLLAAPVSYRKKLVLLPDGVQLRGVFLTRRYAWNQIESVGVRNEYSSVNFIPTTVVRYLQISVNGKDIDLPAPRAGRFLGREDFEEKAVQFHRLWLLQTGQRIS
jgi:hypothetical protein